MSSSSSQSPSSSLTSLYRSSDTEDYMPLTVSNSKIESGPEPPKPPPPPPPPLLNVQQQQSGISANKNIPPPPPPQDSTIRKQQQPLSAISIQDLNSVQVSAFIHELTN